MCCSMLKWLKDIKVCILAVMLSLSDCNLSCCVMTRICLRVKRYHRLLSPIACSLHYLSILHNLCSAPELWFNAIVCDSLILWVCRYWFSNRQTMTMGSRRRKRLIAYRAPWQFLWRISWVFIAVSIDLSFSSGQFILQILPYKISSASLTVTRPFHPMQRGRRASLSR